MTFFLKSSTSFMDKKIQDLARDFIDNSDYFSQETITDLDIKHKDIISANPALFIKSIFPCVEKG
ncbi:hypothetical protein QMM44_17220, partial [Leptospira santarosai]|nr:hypothetical protein [Leptospira santarosai]